MILIKRFLRILDFSLSYRLYDEHITPWFLSLVYVRLIVKSENTTKKIKIDIDERHHSFIFSYASFPSRYLILYNFFLSNLCCVCVCSKLMVIILRNCLSLFWLIYDTKISIPKKNMKLKFEMSRVVESNKRRI